MPKIKNSERLRKIINYCLLMVLIILLALLGLKMYKARQNYIYTTSPLEKVVNTMSLDDLDSATTELAGDSFVYVTYTESKDVYTFEKQLKRTIVNNNLQNNFYLLDATDLKLEDNYLKELNKKFDLKENTIKALPVLLYYKDGKIVKVLTSTKKDMINNDAVLNLLDSYELLESN